MKIPRTYFVFGSLVQAFKPLNRTKFNQLRRPRRAAGTWPVDSGLDHLMSYGMHGTFDRSSCGVLTQRIMDDGYGNELQDIYSELMDGNFLDAAKSLCSKTETIAADRAGTFRIVGGDCYDDCIDNARCDEKCNSGGYCCSRKDQISERNCPLGKLVPSQNHSVIYHQFIITCKN